MKKIGLLASLVLMAVFTFAQSLDEGKKFLNYEKFESARGVFNKLIQDNPNNIDAIYWLGQTYLQNQDVLDVDAAASIYQKALQANANSALLMVGIGEVELMQGKTADARNRFETAINLTKKKDLADILLAVGRANVDAKAGDANYAVEKLKLAADRDKKNPAIQVVLGDAYRKLIDGGNANLAYQTALSMDPSNAKPAFMMGRIYETQGYGQESIYMKYYNEAMTIDPNYAPVYYWLYNYYYQRDVNKAREYLTKYVSLADKDSKNCYAEASLLFVSKMYDQAIQKADGCITGATDGKPFPNLYGLKAYAYKELGDSVNSKKFFEEYFKNVSPEKIGPNDYVTYAQVLMKFPGNEAAANSYIDKAISLDTVPAKKVEYVTNLAKGFYDEGKFADAGLWYTKVLQVNPNFGKVDLYWAGYSNYRAEKYKAADSVFTVYQQKFPDDAFGWYMGARSKEGLDSAALQGLAKPDYEKIIQLAANMPLDSIADKLIPAYKYMIAYYYNVKADIPNAAKYNDLVLTVDPNDAAALSNKEAFAQLLKRKTDSTKPAGK